MHLRDVVTVRPGTVLAKTVYTERGDVLLAEGIVLTQSYIDALRNRGCATIQVQDGLSDDVHPNNIVPEHVRATTAAHVAKMFDIVALSADVFSALASERPYKPAFPMDQVRSMLQEMAGHPLNRDVVDALLKSIPMFAVGHWVEVQSGTYRGWRGVVTAVDASALHAPTVRLHLDARRETVNVPVELDLKRHDGVHLICIPPGEAPFAPPVEHRSARAT